MRKICARLPLATNYKTDSSFGAQRLVVLCVVLDVSEESFLLIFGMQNSKKTVIVPIYTASFDSRHCLSVSL
jgi:hypothetical protein